MKRQRLSVCHWITRTSHTVHGHRSRCRRQRRPHTEVRYVASTSVKPNAVTRARHCSRFHFSSHHISIVVAHYLLFNPKKGDYHVRLNRKHMTTSWPTNYVERFNIASTRGARRILQYTVIWQRRWRWWHRRRNQLKRTMKTYIQTKWHDGM